MMPDQYIALMQRALRETRGVKLTFDTRLETVRARRKLYKLRAKAQEAGNCTFDKLSICYRPPATLLVFPRDKLAFGPIDDGVAANSLPLSVSDMPLRFKRPRGPRQSAHMRQRWQSR